ncbi:MAG: coenzyme F420-0:L-glutamate ligase, partial [Thermoprotei archaeon]
VIVTDTYGRPLREGHVDMAIGASGIRLFRDYRGSRDLKGYVLRVKRIAVADEIAGAAELVMGNGAEGIPVVVIRGLRYEVGEEPARLLNMREEKWLFK